MPNAETQHDQPLPLGEAIGRAARTKKSRHRVRSRHERAGRRAGVPVKQISLSIPAALAEQWRTRSQGEKHSLVDVMLDAVVAHKPELPNLVRDLQTNTRTGRVPVSDGTFLRLLSTGETAERNPYVTIPLRMLSTNIDTLDSLAYETAAESRSQLVVAALTAFLAEEGPTEVV